MYSNVMIKNTCAACFIWTNGSEVRQKSNAYRVQTVSYIFTKLLIINSSEELTFQSRGGFTLGYCCCQCVTGSAHTPVYRNSCNLKLCFYLV